MTPRRIFRIARWEIAKSVGGTDRRAAVAILVVLVSLGGMAPMLVASSPSPGEDLYRVGVEPSNPYYEPVRASSELRVVSGSDDDLHSGDIEVLIDGKMVKVRDSASGQAAGAAFREAVISYNDRAMRSESDEAAAFPVVVSLSYTSRDGAATSLLDAAGSGSVDDGGADDADGGDATATQQSDQSEDVAGSADEDPSPTADEDTSDANDDDRGTEAERTSDGIQAGGADGVRSDSGPLDGILGTTQTGTPSSISPPFPLRSLLLAFVFLLPFNVVIQAYGSSIFAERINRRAEPLLVSPASRADIVLGKTLPYLVGSVVITAVIAFGIGAGIRSVAAIVPLAALFLGASFVAGLLSRSYKELTFVTVTISVVVTGYAFVPAVFTQVHPIAAISPLSVVVSDLQSAPFSPGAFVLSTVPVTLAAVVLFVLGTGMVREEHMFTRRPLPARTLDALAAPLGARWTVGLWTALFVPFVFVAELFVVSALFVLPAATSIPVLLAAIAVIEEVAKSLHVYAGFERGRFPRGSRTAVVLGTVSGIGFFLAEKLMAITQLVGLPQLDVGQVAFGPAIGGFSPGLLLVAPLFLHVTTATISAVGAARSRLAYLLGLSVAILVHLGYNLAVVSVLA
ncbi:ABC-type Na+ efflux pump, permease component [Halanaeroarchaeum sp. HSR-CO]|uniref:PrsW family intramembrane metalloprotease n=1 Tax=Halanaeroarchaeum sp. HSR-CO TaxID=2866382 RepID=UPI00217F02FD|nr:PrsW family intramembrane metalloprotease [Halanaeroarchaeum sp. HSR-CO]UWG47641.1 ABC-type Na+ efflux pump, permease component [Halanaeroarchaeum sp. HSR-CO]